MWDKGLCTSSVTWLVQWFDVRSHGTASQTSCTDVSLPGVTYHRQGQSPHLHPRACKQDIMLMPQNKIESLIFCSRLWPKPVADLGFPKHRGRQPQRRWQPVIAGSFRVSLVIHLGCLQNVGKMPWHLLISTLGCSHWWDFFCTECHHDIIMSWHWVIATSQPVVAFHDVVFYLVNSSQKRMTVKKEWVESGNASLALLPPMLQCNLSIQFPLKLLKCQFRGALSKSACG